tara:strand:- start:597 stop:1952 length:1356 start_codon:yes stop_codon:yes gene_type:complete
MSDAFSESLAYPAQKQRAVASRSYRVKVNPANGQTFTSGQTINIDLPSNLAGTYLNWNQCYLKMKVTNITTELVLDRCGAAGFIERVQCQTSGAQIFDCPNWNVLMTLLMDMDSSPAYKAGYGNVLMGTNGGHQAGETLGATDTRTYCVPFTLHPFGLSTPHRLQPLFSLAPVQFKLSLASKQLSGKATADTSNLTFSEVELVCVFTELSPGAQAQVDAMTGGVYNILASSYQNVGTNMTGGATAVTANLGVSVSSLERVIVCHRPTASIGAAFFNLGNRVKNYLTQYQIFVNGESYPARPVIVEDSCAEALAEFLLSDHSLVDFNKQSSFNLAINGNLANLKSNALDGQSVNGITLPFKFDTALGAETGSTATAAVSNIGTFLTAVEMETGLSDGKSAKIYSGISTISSTVNYRGVYGSTSAAAQIDFFCQYTVLLSLNMRGTGVWSVAV